MSFAHMGHAARTQALMACGGLQISSKQSWRVSLGVCGRIHITQLET